MDNTRLQYIETVARYGSISRASEALFITPSALSKFIKKIEDENHILLFDRVGKKFVLTYAGERYVHWLNNIKSLYEQMDEEMNEISNAYTGRVKVGVQLGGSSLLIDNILPKFYKQFPRTLVDIYEDTSNRLRERLDDNSLDFAVLPAGNLSNSVSTVDLCPLNRVLAIPKGHTLASHAITKKGHAYPWIDITSLSNEHFVAPFPEQDAYRIYQELINDGVNLHINTHIKNITSQLKCVVNNLGFTISVDNIVQSSGFIDKIDMLSFGKSPLLGKLVIAYNNYHYINKPSTALMELIQEAYSNRLQG